MTTQVSATSMFALMNDALTNNAAQVSNVKGRIKSSIAKRREYEMEVRNGDMSADFDHVEALYSDTVAAFMVAISMKPEYIINSPSYTPEEFEAKSGISQDAKTKNLKAYKKLKETAEYFAHGSHLEKVLKTVVACSILASQYHDVIPRDVCERFLNSLPMNRISEELSEAIEDFRAKHMTGGAATQFSQCSLQLANMRAGFIVRNGRFKDFKLNLDSPVIESFAQKLGLEKEYQKAREYRARLESETA